MTLAQFLAQADSGPSSDAATEVLQYGALGAFVVALAWLAIWFIRDMKGQRDRAVDELAATIPIIREMRDREVELLHENREAMRENREALRETRDALRSSVEEIRRLRERP